MGLIDQHSFICFSDINENFPMILKKFLLSNFLNSADEQFHLARTTITSSNDLQLHNHDYTEIFWITEGEGLHLINGNSITIKKGTLVIVRPEDNHTFKLIKSNQRMVITNLAFRISNMDFYLSRYSSFSQTFFPQSNQPLFSTQLTPSILSLFSSHADQMFADPRDVLHLDMMVLFIFHALQEHVSDNKCIPHWLSHALEHYTTADLFIKGIQGFVELTGKSTDHVNKALQQFLDQSLTETINKARLKYASNRLIMTNSPIKTITLECGYATVNYFHRIFKKHYGLTPAEYRNKNIKIF